MNTTRYDFIEFSKIYKRVMDIELSLKENLKFSLTATFPNRMFRKLEPFLKANFQGRYVKKRRDKLLDLINSNKTEEEKVHEFINMAYLSDLLSILTEYPTIYKDKNFKRAFYRQKIIFNDLKMHASRIKRLRNAIMHFDISTYKSYKKDYLLSLSYWEQLLNCSTCFIHKLPQVKPKISHILKLLSQHKPDFFETSDRIICDIYDEIAFLNGCQVKDLPEYWSIVRAIYNLKQKRKYLI